MCRRAAVSFDLETPVCFKSYKGWSLPKHLFKISPMDRVHLNALAELCFSNRVDRPSLLWDEAEHFVQQCSVEAPLTTRAHGGQGELLAERVRVVIFVKPWRLILRTRRTVPHSL